MQNESTPDSGATRLSRESIVAAAMRLAARPDVVALRIRDIGQELGVDPSAVYRHFPSKEVLMSALADELLAEVGRRRDVTGLTWKDRLRETANSLLDVYLEYPSIGADVALLPTSTTGVKDQIEGILDALHEAGLRDEELVDQYALFSSYLLSFASTIARSHTSFGRDSDLRRPWVPDAVSATRSRHPRMAALRDDLLELVDVEVFRRGIELLLDGIEREGRRASEE